MSTWYAVRSATRQESRAMRSLVEQGRPVFLPCETRMRRLGGSLEAVSRPLFAGYLFVLCDECDFPDVLEADGVHQFLRYGSGDDLKPFPFPASEILKLQISERAGEFDYTRAERISYRPRRGDRVKVTAGPWQTFCGQVIQAPSAKRAKVKLEGPYGNTQTLDIAHLAAA